MRSRTQYLADVVLRSAVGCWFLVTLVGQWLFMYYIVALYGAPTVSGHFEGWARKTTLLRGYVPGDTVGNLAFAAHVLFAAVVSFGGALQLVPQIRDHAIAVHRWNGRAFLAAAIVLSGGGLYMVWVRHASLHLVNMARRRILGERRVSRRAAGGLRVVRAGLGRGGMGASSTAKVTARTIIQAH